MSFNPNTSHITGSTKNPFKGCRTNDDTSGEISGREIRKINNELCESASQVVCGLFLTTILFGIAWLAYMRIDIPLLKFSLGLGGIMGGCTLVVGALTIYWGVKKLKLPPPIEKIELKRLQNQTT